MKIVKLIAMLVAAMVATGIWFALQFAIKRTPEYDLAVRTVLSQDSHLTAKDVGLCLACSQSVGAGNGRKYFRIGLYVGERQGRTLVCAAGDARVGNYQYSVTVYPGTCRR